MLEKINHNSQAYNETYICTDLTHSHAHQLGQQVGKVRRVHDIRKALISLHSLRLNRTCHLSRNNSQICNRLFYLIWCLGLAYHLKRRSQIARRFLRHGQARLYNLWIEVRWSLVGRKFVHLWLLSTGILLSHRVCFLQRYFLIIKNLVKKYVNKLINQKNRIENGLDRARKICVPTREIDSINFRNFQKYLLS